jgi:hypothetical protein
MHFRALWWPALDETVLSRKQKGISGGMPATSEYLILLGRATWAFSSLEWNVVCVLRRLFPNYVGDRYRLPHKPASGQIANDFSEVAGVLKAEQLKARMTDVAEAFSACVDRRNDLVHSAPATISGEQMLNRMTERSSLHWTRDELASATRQFDQASKLANRLLHSDLLKSCCPLKDEGLSKQDVAAKRPRKRLRHRG